MRFNKSQRGLLWENLQLHRVQSRGHEHGSIVARILDVLLQLRLLLQRAEQRHHRQLVMMSVKCWKKFSHKYRLHKKFIDDSHM